MTEPPPTPSASPDLRSATGILRAGWGEAAGRALLAVVFVWLLGLLPALILWAWGGPGGLLRTPALAWLYVSAFHAVPLIATGSTRALLMLSPTASVRFILFACPMLGTLAALALCFHAGRGLARTSMARVETRAPWIVLASAARIAIVYGLAFLGVSAVAKLSFTYGAGPTVTTILAHPVVSHAFLAPFLIAFVGALAGAYTTVRRRASGAVRTGAACVTGGAAALTAGIALGIIGWTVLAVAKPDATAAYARWLAARGAVGASAVVTNQVLALPNHGMLVLAPAMGACDRLAVISAQRDLVCLRHVAGIPERALSVPSELVPRLDSQRHTPTWFLAFLLVPAAGCWVGGVMGVREFGRDRAAVGAKAAALVGAGGGATFAVLCCVGAMLVTVRVDAFFGTRPALVSIGPDPWVTGMLGLGWGLVFCTAGALVSGLRRGARTSEVGATGPERPDSGSTSV